MTEVTIFDTFQLDYPHWCLRFPAGWAIVRPMTTEVSDPPPALHLHFLKAIKPVIERQARVSFRQYARDPDKMEELTQAATALAWKRYLDLMKRDKDPAAFVTVFAARCCQGVRNGRGLTGTERAKDAMSPRAQREKGFRVQRLPEHDTTDQREHDALEALKDSSRSPPDEQVAFRNDYQGWINRLPRKKARIVNDLANGETTGSAAHRHDLSQARISQIRDESKQDWAEYPSEGIIR